MKNGIFVGLSVVLLTLLGYQFFPGHTFLQQDAQIYLPMLEHMWDPSVLQKDLVATRPHVTFTIYDEMALLLRGATGLDFQAVLTFQQLVFRALGILGVFLIGTALHLSARMSVLAAAIFSLGAVISGPAVLTIEYEPIPRGFAVPLLIFAVGLVAHNRHMAAGIAASIAFLYHPPTTYAFWTVYFCLALWPAKPELMIRRIRGLAPLGVAVCLLFVLSRMQPGVTEAQVFFSRVGPELENLQRMRASYNWVSTWIGNWLGHYLLLWMVSLAALFRLRDSLTQETRFFLCGMPLIGILSVPLSYLLLEKAKWAVIPQAQPQRALLFVTVVALITAAAAGVRAAQRGKLPGAGECFAWLSVCFAIPLHARISELLLPDLGNPVIRRRVLVLVALAACGSLAAWLDHRYRRAAIPAWMTASVAGFFLIPGYGQVTNYIPQRMVELSALSSWAKSNTPAEAVFLFADARKGLEPGVFRPMALRAVYVDWKSGGQVNFHEAFARQWWSRWESLMDARYLPTRVYAYAEAGVDYVVLSTRNRHPKLKPVYENASYLVYSMEPVHEILRRSAGSAR